MGAGAPAGEVFFLCNILHVAALVLACLSFLVIFPDKVYIIKICNLGLFVLKVFVHDCPQLRHNTIHRCYSQLFAPSNKTVAKKHFINTVPESI